MTSIYTPALRCRASWIPTPPPLLISVWSVVVIELNALHHLYASPQSNQCSFLLSFCSLPLLRILMFLLTPGGWRSLGLSLDYHHVCVASLYLVPIASFLFFSFPPKIAAPRVYSRYNSGRQKKFDPMLLRWTFSVFRALISARFIYEIFSWCFLFTFFLGKLSLPFQCARQYGIVGEARMKIVAQWIGKYLPQPSRKRFSKRCI